MPEFSVEMDDSNISKYGKIHAAGCRDLRDEMPLGQASTLEGLHVIFNDNLGWDYEIDSLELSPCARKHFVQERFM